MSRPRVPQLVADVLLGVAAVGVVGAAAFAVTRTPATDPVPVVVLEAGGRPSASSAQSTHLPTPQPVWRSAAIVLVGPDLARVQDQLATLTGHLVTVVDGTAAQVLAPGALAGLDGVPRAVVLEVLAGQQTTVRTAAAIAVVRGRWSEVPIIVVGPFSSADRKSATSVQAAALAAKVTFLDPVALHWRRADTSATLTATDLQTVATELAAALR